MIVQPAMLYWMETVSNTSSNDKKLEMKGGHTLRDHVRNDNVNE